MKYGAGSGMGRIEKAKEAQRKKRGRKSGRKKTN